MQYQKIIEQLGYSRKEAKIYLAALRLGESHISDIANKVQMPRSTVQAVVDRLQADGLMNFYVMRRYKYWVAANPEQLLKTLKEKERLVEEAIPALVEMRKMARQRYRGEKLKFPISEIYVRTNNSPHPILIADETGVIQFVNTEWEKLFGYTLSEVQGSHTRMLGSSETSKEVYEDLWNALSKERMFQTDTIFDKKKDGSIFQMRTTIFTLRYGSSVYYVQVLEEIQK